MLTFFAAQIDERTDAPREDLLSVLAASIPEDEDGSPDVLANCIFFVEAGHATTTSLISAAANRDPDVVPEPDRFDVDRAPGHLALSAGAHFCLGAPLARLHGEIALTTLLARLPGLRSAGDPEWRGFVPLHELEHLPVAWDVANLRRPRLGLVLPAGSEP